MTLLLTDAIVLHVFDYLESSRIVRLATRDAGMQSAIAKGARRSRKRFGGGLDLFAQGSAQLLLKPTRDLQTLAAFDVVRGRPGLAQDLERFAAAAAIAEVVLRFGGEDASPGLYAVLSEGLDAVERTDASAAPSEALGVLWRMIAEMGFAPTLDDCASCHAAVPPDQAAVFAHAAGGALCERCASHQPGGRTLPPAARDTLRSWLADEPAELLPVPDVRAHQRLLREFLQRHLGDDRPLRALLAWERGELAQPAVSVR